MVDIIGPIVVAVVIAIGTVLVRTMMRGLKTYLDDEIKSRLVPNGGSSLADRLASVEERVSKLASIFEDHECPNPGCPRRFACEHTQPAGRKRMFRGRSG
jgi:hypothetical protein